MASPTMTVALCSPTGKLGPQLLQTLQAEGFSVTIVLRESSKATFTSDQKIIRVSDEYLKDELIAAFQGQDAVVLSLSFEMLSQSKKFAEASIAAGNKWFIASTYGANLNDPKHALFPASIPHRQALDELMSLEKDQDTWSWSSISCGPWPELVAAARAWNIDAAKKTVELVDGGSNVFTATTRAQVALAAARVLKKQPISMKSQILYIASFEASMMTWLDAYKQIVGAEGWQVTNVDGETLLKRSQAQLAAGKFGPGYMGTALVVCTAHGYQNHFSRFASLANDALDLPKENMVEVVRAGLLLPDPFA